MARAALGWGVRELAAAAKVSVDALARFERGSGSWTWRRRGRLVFPAGPPPVVYPGVCPDERSLRCCIWSRSL